MKFIITLSLFLYSVVANSAETKPKDSLDRITPHAHYSSYSFDGEHGGGANLWLWKNGKNTYIGVFHIYEGDVEYGAESEITDVVVKGSSISFSYRQEFQDASNGKPVLGDKLKFQGTVAKGHLSGKVTYPSGTDKVKMKVIATKKASEKHPFFKEFSTVEEWRANTPPKKKQF